MRVSSSLLYDSTVTEMSSLQSKMIETQRQIASGQKLTSASENPVAAARVLDLSQLESMNTQFADNRLRAQDALTFAESTLQSTTELLLNLRTDVIAASSVAGDASARSSLALNFHGRLQSLIGLANTTDEGGNFLFSGFQSQTPPFSNTPAGVAYMGDDGQRNIQVASARKMPATYPGSDIFMRIKTGNEQFDVVGANTNTGNAYPVLGAVTDPSAFTEDSYQVSFSVDSVTNARTYTVVNQTSGATLASDVSFSAGQTLSFDGVEFNLNGLPNDGDTFTLAPSVNESVFTTIKNLVTALESGENVTEGIQRARSQLDQVIDNVMNTRTKLGLGLNELDHLNDTGTEFDLQFKQSLSKLRDTDYAEAVSDLMQQQTSLQAAQASFSKISSMSLFNYIN